ncbi:MAG: NAD-dependent succinate-semialdehyde dehydrogenase [Longimicrobiaceae bacterium]
MPQTAINPASGDTVREVADTTPEEACALVDAAHDAFLEWRRTGFGERADRLRAAASVLRERSGGYARLMAEEMGKPVSQGRAEVEKCAWACDYFADHGEGFLQSEEVETDASRSFVSYQPLGVILAVMPWNFPFWQVFRFAAPHLMAGNAGVLKHASNVPGCAQAIEEVFREAGFPPGLFRAVFLESDGVAGVIDHPKVRAVTLTGSVGAGKAVAGKAGSLVKKSVLELGGSDPYLILADADLEVAVETCVRSRLINSGQSCIAAKRFVVVEAVLDRFTELFVRGMKAARVGDPQDEKTEVGPLARADLRDQLHEQVEKSVGRGARLLLGGEIPDGPGSFYPPTVLAAVKPGAPAYEEELFGPVAAVIGVRDEGEAVRVANDTSFGLGAAVFTRDLERGARLAEEELEAGACFVNGLVKSDPRLPFGGVKESGYGRELARAGMLEFVNAKSVYVA